MANDPIVTKLGNVSAYLDAVAHGFTGTRAEFGELLANSEKLSSDVTQLKADLQNMDDVLNSFSTVTTYPIGECRSGYIRFSENNTGTIGSSPDHVVYGYDGARLNLKGDGKTYRITKKSGWVINRIGEYASTAVGSFVQFLDINSEITLAADKYYCIQVGQSPTATTAPTDVPSDAIVLAYKDYTDKSLSISGKPADSEAVGNLMIKYHSYNWCDPEEITAHQGKWMKPDGSTGAGPQYAYTGMIPVDTGDIVYLLKNSMIKTEAQYRYVTAFDASKTVVTASGADVAGRTYTVPNGIKYVVVTIMLSGYSASDFSINVGKMMPFDAYDDSQMPKGYKNARDAEMYVSKMPLSAMPAYVRNAMAYRPLQPLSKGYMCLVSDDGKEGLATYTCPMVITKDVPCTFAVMSDSEVFADNTLKETVLDAVENHGCTIAQHGGRNWTEYSEYGLNQFFDEEKAFFDTLGVSVKSAVIPSHYTTPTVQLVAGGRFGVVRSGLKGYDAEGNYGNTVHNYYDFFTSGEGSNIYGLSSYNLSGYSLATNKLAVDYAYANNKILIVYWHENALNASKKAVIEDTIDYAKTKGLEFITLDKIPYLTETLSQF